MSVCRACVVHCIDRRIQNIATKLVQHLGFAPGEYDLVSIPGGAANIGVMLEGLEISCKVNGAQKLILTIHEDCRYHAAYKRFDWITKVTSSFDLPTECYVIKLDGSWTKWEAVTEHNPVAHATAAV